MHTIDRCALHWWNPAAPFPRDGCPCRRGVTVFLSHELVDARLVPLPEISGTFSMLDGSVEIKEGDEVFFYTQKNVSLFYHLLYSAREHLFGVPYPQEQVFSGHVKEWEAKEDGIVEGTFGP